MTESSTAQREEVWRQRLRCPACHSRLHGETHLECSGDHCGRKFTLLDGVPVIFDESRSLYSLAAVERGRQGVTRGRRWKTAFERVLPTLERNLTARRNSESFARHLLRSSPRPLVLNIGGKHAGATCASLRSHLGVQVVELDVRPGPRATLIADPLQIPIDDATFDAVIIDAVLEHVVDPALAVSEIRRVLKPGGLVYSDVPFMLQVHGGALDFWRFSHVGHRLLFRDFEEISSGISQGPGVALACSIQYFLMSFVRGKPARYAVRTLCRGSLWWLKYFDVFLGRLPGGLDAAMGSFFMGRRAEAPVSDRDVLAAYRGASPGLYPVR